MEEVLSAPILIEKFDAELINSLLAKLAPERCRHVPFFKISVIFYNLHFDHLYSLSRYLVISKSFAGKTDLKDELYEIDYSIKDIPPAFIQVLFFKIKFI